MFTTCPACGAHLDLTLTATQEAPAPGRSDSFVVGLVGTGLSTVREVADAVAGRKPTAAEMERTRRQLNRLVTTGQLRVRNMPTSGGRPMAVYGVAS